MNYHLNFHRIFGEDRPEKINQLKSHLNVLADVISPENGFSLYFLAYLDYKTGGQINSDYVERLENRLETSHYWRDRFKAFNLTLEHLHNCDFSSKEETILIKQFPSQMALEVENQI